jgi:uncharacterized membrane protein/tetratricopeptide (TPR) repeat protein
MSQGSQPTTGVSPAPDPPFPSAPPATKTGRSAPRRLAHLCQPEWFFLAMALPFGIAFLIIIPPFQVPDEEAHLRRAFQISEGRIIAEKRAEGTGDALPPGMEELYYRFKAMKGRPQEKTSAGAIRDSAGITWFARKPEFVVFSNSAIHPPLTYLPQALGLFVARRLSPSVLHGLYIGRFFNLMATAVLTFLAVRRTPVGKWVFAALALTPMALSLNASLSPDALTNALSFLLAAQVLWCAFGPEAALSVRSVVLTALLGAAVGLAKQMYFLLPLCFLLIPLRKLGTRRSYLAAFALVLGVTFLAVAAWGSIVARIWSPADPTMGIDPGRQFAYLRANPVEFVRVLGRTAQGAVTFVQQYLGSPGWGELRLPTPAYVVELALLVALCLSDFGPGSGVTPRQAGVAAGVALAVCLTILVVMHLTWDAVGAEAISLHGRYFIPVGPLAGMALGRLGFLVPSALRRVFAPLPAAAALAVPVLLTVSLAEVHRRYFVDTADDAAERHAARGTELIGEQNEASLPLARKEFEEAVRIKPDHVVARLWLGLMLKESDPREAEAHFRAVLQSAPHNSVALFELANVLTARADYAGAIPLYREALNASAGNDNVKSCLAAALREESTGETLAQLGRAVRELAESDLLESPGPGGGRLCLRADRGRLRVPPDKPALARAEFFWRNPPPGGPEICLGDARAAAGPRGRAPFYACSGRLILGKRVFVFALPANAKLLADGAVSWFYQVPLAELDGEELRREEAYRREHGLRFPLRTLPE